MTTTLTAYEAILSTPCAECGASAGTDCRWDCTAAAEYNSELVEDTDSPSIEAEDYADECWWERHKAGEDY